VPTSVEDVAEICLAFPQVVEGERHGHRTWFVGKKAMAWERPFSKADVKRFGEEPVPQGDILALTVEDLAEKEAVLAAGQKGFFTIPHFDGYAAVLVELDLVGKRPLRAALEDAWLAVAPDALAEEWLAGRKGR
jgi:hypothetical protein